MRKLLAVVVCLCCVFTSVAAQRQATYFQDSVIRQDGERKTATRADSTADKTVHSEAAFSRMKQELLSSGSTEDSKDKLSSGLKHKAVGLDSATKEKLDHLSSVVDDSENLVFFSEDRGGVSILSTTDTESQPFSTNKNREPTSSVTTEEETHRSPTADPDQNTRQGKASRPHIVMIVADDLGWNDVSWRDSSMYTPELEKLASKGVILNQSYVQPVCSPSRAAFMSGYYPYHLGLQHDSLRATQKAYLPANLTTLPQHLKKLGYSTHMAGKWHLGFCNWRYTPTYRGFDTFVGFYNAIQDYYSHIGHHNGYDFRHNEEVYYSANGTYSAFIFTQYIEQVIVQHDVTKPLFVYLPYQSVHGPLQVPQEYIDKYCSHIQNETRRTKCGMIAALDEGVGNVTRALRARGILDDTLLFFTTDNGGPVPDGANNWPLRGSKTTLWEGGTRATAFLHAPNILPWSGTYEGVIHAVDWLPTLVEAAGGKVGADLDGMSHWTELLNNTVPSARKEFLYNMDEMKKNSALRQGKFKLLQGPPGHPSGWYPPPTLMGTFDSNLLEEEITSTATTEESPFMELLSGHTYGRGLMSSGSEVVHMTSEDDVMAKEQYLLFDLEADPTERSDVKHKYPDVFKQMRERLEEYRKSLVPANFPPHDPDALPSHFNGTWSPGWC